MDISDVIPTPLPPPSPHNTMFAWRLLSKWLGLDGYMLYNKQHRRVADGDTMIRSATIGDYVTLSRLNSEIFEDGIDISVADIVGRNTFVYIAVRLSDNRPVGFMMMEDCDGVVVIQRMGVLHDHPNPHGVYHRFMSLLTPGAKIACYVDRQHPNQDDVCRYYTQNGYRQTSVTPVYRYFESS